MLQGRTRSGFTLIEVMIAVVILAVGLSSLFTSEAGAVKIAQRARGTTIATLLARCKMGEVEEKISKEGWPADGFDGRDECCEDAEQEGFKCEWKVERVTLPETNVEDGPKVGGSDAKEAAKAAVLGKAGGDAKDAPGEPIKPAGPLSTLENITKSDGGLGEILTPPTPGEGESDPMAAMAMELALPVMKPVIEEGVRRATVTVIWKEGSREQTFDVVQYLVNELPALPDENTTQGLLGTGASDGGVPQVSPGG